MPHVMRCARVTDAAVAALAGPALRRVELYWNLRVTDGLLQALARASPRLAVLNLSGCKQLTDAGVAAVARACPRLTHVDLTRCVEPWPLHACISGLGYRFDTTYSLTSVGVLGHQEYAGTVQAGAWCAGQHCMRRHFHPVHACIAISDVPSGSPRALRVAQVPGCDAGRVRGAGAALPAAAGAARVRVRGRRRRRAGGAGRAAAAAPAGHLRRAPGHRHAHVNAVHRERCAVLP